MAELRLTGPTEDGDALLLAAPDGSEHVLPTSPYLRRLVLEAEQRDADDAAAPDEVPAPDGGPDAPGAAGAPRAEDGDPSPAAEGGQDDGPEADLPVVDLTPRIRVRPVDTEAEDAPAVAVERPADAPSTPPSRRPEPVRENTPAPAVPSAPTPAAEAPAAPPARPDTRESSAAEPTRPIADQESVRAAATQEAPPLAPREIQARIRAGATVEQVARESGNSYARIRTYGHPVLAERGWIAQQARGTEVWVGGPDLYSDVVSDGGPTTLGELAAHRLAELGVSADSLAWDAWREHAGAWTVAATFDVAGARSGLPTREDPPARWSYRPGGAHLDPLNTWARVLSDAQAWDVASAVAEPAAAEPEDAAADVRAQDDDADLGQWTPVPAPAPDPGADVTLSTDAGPAEEDGELLDILRSRRGRRVGQDEASDEALAHLIAREAVQREAAEEQRAERERAERDRTAAPAEPTSRAARLLRGLPALPDEETTEPSAEAPSQAERPGPADSEPGTSQDGRADGAPADGERPASEEDASERPRPARPAMPTPRPRARSAGRRPSVPSWDDIVFGRKGD